MIFDSFTFAQTTTISVCSFAVIYTNATSTSFAPVKIIGDYCCECPSVAIASSFAIISRNSKSQGWLLSGSIK